uniref:Uncharacterized protein n=1 Tax=Quercus lobata TaxID=97700 RepID=A0A7N2LWF8_QUELO
MAFKFLQNHPILALILALLSAHEILYTVFAASGGRMGGSSFASEEESSSCSSSKSYNIYHYDNNPRFISGYIDYSVGIYLSIAYLNRASVLRVQVGLSGMAHSIQRELNTLATAVDTSKNKSFHFFLTVCSSSALTWKLLDFWLFIFVVVHNLNNSDIVHPVKWFSLVLRYNFKVERRWNLEAVEKELRQLSTDERLKYDIESLVNVDNMKVQRTFIPRNNKVEKNHIVVTILVAVKGTLNLPEIKSTEDLRTALHYLNTISSNNTLAVEVLWSPQAEHDTLSEDELLENYLLLRPI